MCKCVECGKPVNDCNEQYCLDCLMRWVNGPDDSRRSLKAGGRFYGENLIKNEPDLSGRKES